MAAAEVNAAGHVAGREVHGHEVPVLEPREDPRLARDVQEGHQMVAAEANGSPAGMVMMSNVGVTLACAVLIAHTPKELLEVVLAVAVDVGAVGDALPPPPPPPPQLIASTPPTSGVKQRILKRRRSRSSPLLYCSS